LEQPFIIRDKRSCRCTLRFRALHCFSCFGIESLVYCKVAFNLLCHYSIVLFSVAKQHVSEKFNNNATNDKLYLCWIME
jgi:hypothetical protein